MYLARDLRHDSQVAIKVLRPDLALSEVVSLLCTAKRDRLTSSASIGLRFDLSRSTVMKSAPRGTPTSGIEVTNVSPNDCWLLLDGQEHFVAFTDFPWFHDATNRQLARIERPSSHHLRWPDLDGDLAVDSLMHPDRYPLVSRVRPNPRVLRTAPSPRTESPANAEQRMAGRRSS